jgi:hypothetical protein
MWWKVFVGLFCMLMGSLLTLALGFLPVMVGCAIVYLALEVWGRVAKKAKG